MTDECISPSRPGLEFFRPKAIRRLSEKSQPRDVSTSPASSVSQLSPLPASPTGTNRASPSSLIPPGRRPVNKSKDSTGSKETAIISSPSEASSEGSGSSPGHKRLGFSRRRLASSATKDVRPPREARDGFVWRLLPNGYWFERKRKSLTSGYRRRTDEHEENAPTTPNIVHAIRQPPRTTDVDAPSWGSNPREYSPAARRVSWDVRLGPPVGEKDGFFNRSKRFIKGIVQTPGTQKEPLLPDTASNKSKTGLLLEKTSIALQSQWERYGGTPNTPPTPPSAGSSSSQKFISALKRKRTALSKSSSVIDLLMGKPPVPTPNKDAFYSGGDRTDYFRVEISEPDGPNFLPSEARRVAIPPLTTDRLRGDGRRGFFLERNSPGEILMSEKSRSTPSSQGSVRNSTLGSENALPFRFNLDEPTEHRFELNVPEHLPGSPLCPRSPLHPSGGKGICVYHGRSRTIQTD